MFRVFKRVTQEEVTALSLETLRLIELGSAASPADWNALRERKIGILERISMDPGPFFDEREGAELQELAPSRGGRAPAGALLELG